MERDAGLEAPDGGESEKVICGYPQQLRLLEDRLQAPGGVGEGLGVEEEGQLDGQLVDGLQALTLDELPLFLEDVELIRETYLKRQQNFKAFPKFHA